MGVKVLSLFPLSCLQWLKVPFFIFRGYFSVFHWTLRSRVSKNRPVNPPKDPLLRDVQTVNLPLLLHPSLYLRPSTPTNPCVFCRSKPTSDSVHRYLPGTHSPVLCPTPRQLRILFPPGILRSPLLTLRSVRSVKLESNTKPLTSSPFKVFDYP